MDALATKILMLGTYTTWFLCVVTMPIQSYTVQFIVSFCV